MASTDAPDRGQPAGGRVPLTKREREILGALAEGMSGAQIAERLVLSPETVRTHVRNAMAKLGASTRSQAVAIALRQHQIGDASALPEPSNPTALAPSGAGDPSAALESMLGSLVTLYDVDGGAVYRLDEDGLYLQRIAAADTAAVQRLPTEVGLGDGALGRAALERRTQLLRGRDEPSGDGALLAAPMLAGGRVVGVIALAPRISRPIGRSETLLLQAFANRVGEVMLAGAGDSGAQLERAMERFRSSWSGATRAI